MWSKSRKFIALGVGIGSGLLAFKSYGLVGVVEAGEKAPFPQQPHCIGKKCPRTQWDNNWDKKEGEEAVERTILVVTRGQADTGKPSCDKKKAQKIANKGNGSKVQHLPNDPSRTKQPKKTANDDPSPGGDGDDDVEGLSPLGKSQVKSFLDFYKEEWEAGGIQVLTLIHGSDPASVATVKMIERNVAQVEETWRETKYSNIETSLLNPLQDQGGLDHPADLARLEAVFRMYFYRQPDDDTTAPGDVDIIVCPPKLVGYFICRSLQIPPERFTGWNVANGSITEIVIYRNGRLGVHRVGDIGYMPPKDVTFE